MSRQWSFLFCIFAIHFLGSVPSASAQASHYLSVCSARFTGPCGEQTQVSPPSMTIPMSVNTADDDGTCVFERLQVTGLASSTMPFAFSATFDSDLCVKNGNDVSGDGSATYEITDEEVTYTRTDQVALPGETVNVRLRFEYRFTASASLDPAPNNGDMSFEYQAAFNISQVSQLEIAKITNFVDAASIDTGWTMVTSGWVEVPLDQPSLTTIRASSLFRNNLDTCASCGGPHFMSASGTMAWRLASTPFEFQGPGVYTADSTNLLIADNVWPDLPTVPVESKTWGAIKNLFSE